MNLSEIFSKEIDSLDVLAKRDLGWSMMRVPMAIII